MRRLSSYARDLWLPLILAIILVGLIVNGLTAPLGLRDLITLRHHQAGLETVRDNLLKKNNALKSQLQRLQSDNRYLESLIRRELGYARPDELVYRFAKDKPGP